MWIEQSGISSAARTDACSVCGSNVNGIPALSSGVDILYEGIIEVCKRCIVEAAHIYGLVEPEKVEALEAEITELRAWADTAYAELGERTSTIETIAAALARTAAERDELRAEAENVVPA